jgi:hypothetical protein
MGHQYPLYSGRLLPARTFAEWLHKLRRSSPMRNIYYAPDDITDGIAEVHGMSSILCGVPTWSVTAWA